MDQNISNFKLATGLISIFLLNLADLYFTLKELQSGVIKEGNPLAVFVYSLNPLYLIGLKVSIVSFVIFIIWSLRKRVSPGIIKMSIMLVLIFYTVLIIYHLQCLSIIPYLSILELQG